MLVSNIMSRQLITIRPEDSIECGARLMAYHNIGAMPVCSNGGKIKGIITDRDIAIRGASGEMSLKEPIKNIMSKKTVTVDAYAEVSEALELMASHKIRRLPVTANNSVVGMISIGDIAKANNLKTEAGQALSEISKHDNI